MGIKSFESEGNNFKWDSTSCGKMLKEGMRLKNQEVLLC